MIDYKKLNGGDLAFFGDAYYTMYIRKYLLDKGHTHLNDLHDETVKYVSRYAQANIVNNILNDLSVEEMDIYKRGRNYNYKTKTDEYLKSSGFEALIGYLYLNKEYQRLEEIILKGIKIIEGE